MKNANTAKATDLYRVTDLDLLPSGNNLMLVHAKRHGKTQYLRPHIVDLLVQCHQFRTLDEHLHSYCRGQRMSAAVKNSLRKELRKLAQSGYLVSRSELLRKFRESSENACQPEIASVGFPTCDRIETLQRSVESCIEHCLSFERDNDFVVVDDSASPSTRSSYRRMLRTLRAKYGVRIAYAGLEEKTEYVNRMIEVGNLPANVVSFACVGDKQYGMTTVGANRNALLLHTTGDLIFSIDDDTVCRVARSPGMQEGVAFSSEVDPLEVWFYQNRETALRSVCYVEQDILALHERWLGKDPLSSVFSRDQDCEVSWNRAEPSLLRSLETEPGRVIITSNGTVGDCAWDDPYYSLFLQGGNFARLTNSKEEYQSARAGREVAQAASRITITEESNPVFAMCIGLDNRGLLPPFMPVGRAEEVIFGAIASRCLGTVYAGHLPWVIPHLPADQRSFRKQHVFSIGPGTFVSSRLNSVNKMPTQSSDEQLRRLGRDLEEVGRLPQAPFEQIARSAVWQNMSSLTSELEERLQNSERSYPALWARDVRAFIELARREALTPINRMYELEGGREPTQVLVSRFGQVLQWWPAMVDTARSLRQEGHRLAQPV